VTAPELGRLRLVPAPLCDPPYDAAQPDRVDLYAPPHRGTQGALALRFVLASGVPARPTGVPARSTGLPCGSPEVADFDRQPTATAALPSAPVWVTRMAQAAVEVLAGTRPVAQLRRWTSDEVYEALRRQSGTARVREPRPDRRRQPARTAPVLVRAVRVCEATDGVVEACAVIDDGRRARALVLRLEGSDGRWRCTRLERL
jgi:hypothetical protein